MSGEKSSLRTSVYGAEESARDRMADFKGVLRKQCRLSECATEWKVAETVAVKGDLILEARVKIFRNAISEQWHLRIISTAGIRRRDSWQTSVPVNQFSSAT